MINFIYAAIVVAGMVAGIPVESPPPRPTHLGPYDWPCRSALYPRCNPPRQLSAEAIAIATAEANEDTFQIDYDVQHEEESEQADKSDEQIQEQEDNHQVAKIRPTPTNFQNVPKPSQDHLTLRIQNLMKNPISLSFSTNAGATAPHGSLSSSTDNGDNLLTPNTTTQLFMPAGWAGQIRLNQPGFAHAEASKIEGAYKHAADPVMTYIDTSYVDGFTFPVTCSSGNSNNNNNNNDDDGNNKNLDSSSTGTTGAKATPDVLTGCNKPLFELNACPMPREGGLCVNPARESHPWYADAFFKPCEHAAYTYPHDDRAGGGRNVDVVDCCVGSGCPAPEWQSD